jgi:hypothetical protein
MADEKTEKKEEKKEDSARKDEHIDVATEKSSGGVGGQTLDNMLSKLDDCMKKMDAVADNMGKRMDAMDGRMDAMKGDAKKDSEKEEKEKADAAKKDADEKAEKEKADAMAKDDKARKDAEGKEGEAEKVAADKKRGDAVADSDDAVRKAIAELEKKLPGIESRLPQQISDADRDAMSDAQLRADNVFAQFGERAPHPLWNETPLPYRRRLARSLSKYSPRWKDTFDDVAESKAFDNIEKDIYADAMTAGSASDGVPDGMLRERTSRMSNGCTETRFTGHISAWMNAFIPTRRALTRLNPKPQQFGG